jgi:putative transposase
MFWSQRPEHGGRNSPDWRERGDVLRQEFGGLKTEQVKRLKDLELENSRLRKAVSDLTLDKLILQEAARGNF